MSNKDINSILLVCMGNICRSPTAEAVLRYKANNRGLKLEIDSAGTIGSHTGESPDSRSKLAAEARGYTFSGITSRKVTASDFEYFDLILAADNHNLDDLLSVCPGQYQGKVRLFLGFGNSIEMEIPDPYYGGEGGFERVLDLIEDAADNFLDRLEQ